MTKGQRAMAVAKILETNNLTQTDAAKAAQLSQARIAQANTVLEYAPDLAGNVLTGSSSRASERWATRCGIRSRRSGGAAIKGPPADSLAVSPSSVSRKLVPPRAARGPGRGESQDRARWG